MPRLPPHDDSAFDATLGATPGAMLDAMSGTTSGGARAQAAPQRDAALDRAALAALVAFYQDWGVDCLALPEPPKLTNTLPPPASSSPAIAPAPIPAPVPAAPPPRRIARDPGENRSVTTDPAAALWGVAAFPECVLARTASHAVRPLLIPGAPLMIIGEAPDADEDRSGESFHGETGRLLDMILTPIGLKRTACSQTAALPWRPPGGRIVTPLEMQSCRELLQGVIKLAQPRKLILLGQTPLKMLINDRATLARSRTKWLTVRLATGESYPAIALQHPKTLLSSARSRREMWKDLLFFKRTNEHETSNASERS